MKRVLFHGKRKDIRAMYLLINDFLHKHNPNRFILRWFAKFICHFSGHDITRLRIPTLRNGPPTLQ